MAKFVEMQVDSIRVHMPSGQHVVILKEKETDRYLPIWIGIYEANAIALKITGITPERPITHDFLANILQSDEKLSIFKELINSMDLPDLEGPPPPEKS